MPETPSTPNTPSRPEHTEHTEHTVAHTERPSRSARPASAPQRSQQQAATTDLSGIATNMQRVRVASDAGIPHAQVLEEAGVQPAPVEVVVVEDEAEVTPAAMVDSVPPPGLGEGDWSPEVTARHPQLLTETMAELLAEMPAADEEPIDPNDRGALQRAQAALGSIETELNDLRNRAAAINAVRLGEAMSALRGASASLRAAVDEAQAAAQPQA